MLDKIKITIPKTTHDILVKDCENFGFFKNNGQLNKNLFLNTLIVNYYERFCSNEELFKEKILSAIKNTNNSEDLLDQIVNVLRKNDSLETDSTSITVNIKPTKLSEKQIMFINNNLIGNNSISSFYRNLFNSYAHNPHNFRELIIFKDNYEVLLEAIEKQRTVSIYLTNTTIIKNASIYKIESSSEELFNYVLLNLNNSPQTIRLSKIKYVCLLNEKRHIPEEMIKTFDRQIECGVQYPFYNSNNEDVIVKLTERGLHLYKRIYLYRPTPFKIEGNLYYFNCSYSQVSQYFKRFGRDAIITSPEHLSETMRHFYFTAYKKYEKLARKYSHEQYYRFESKQK